MERLLSLQGAFLGVLGRPMYKSESRWAARLSEALGVLHEFGEVPFIMIYAQRERVAELTGQDLNTDDLDGFLSIGIPYGREAYAAAVAAGLVPNPPTAKELIESIELEGSEVGQEYLRVLRDYLEQSPEDPLTRLHELKEESGSAEVRKSIWQMKAQR
jgi:hypothetical protein